MRRTMLLAVVLAGLSLLFLPPTNAEQADWKTVKTKVVPLGKLECVSPAFKPKAVGGDRIDLPVAGGKGIPIKITPQKVLIDKDLNGKLKFTAAQGSMSKVFPVTLVYSNGDKVRHFYKITKAGSGWALVRMSALEAAVEGKRIWIIDENNNGIFGEEGEDGIYYAKKPWGWPFSNVTLIGGKLVELKLNESGKELSYRPYAGPTGKLDIFKEWNGKKKPEVVIIQGSTDDGAVFLNAAFKGAIDVPPGNYRFLVAYMKDVFIRGGNGGNFTVEEGGEAAAFKWGMPLKIQAAVSYDRRRKKFTVSPTPRITGAAGESYTGDFLNGNRVAGFKLQLATANGKPVGRPTKWTPTGGC